MDKLPATTKIMDYLARRDHSEKELRKKLSEFYTAEEIHEAIEIAKDKKWLASTDSELLAFSEKVAYALHRKKKGIIFINHYLREKGLPPVKRDEAIELEKAKKLLKIKKFELQKARDKAKRFLASRGFDFETIGKTIKAANDMDI
jgi:regulatory protein